MAITTTERKAPENNDDKPNIEKNAADAAIANAEKPTRYLNSGFLWYVELTTSCLSWGLAFFLVPQLS